MCISIHFSDTYYQDKCQLLAVQRVLIKLSAGELLGGRFTGIPKWEARDKW